MKSEESMFPPVLFGNPGAHEREQITNCAQLFGMSMFNERPEFVLNVGVMLMVMALSGIDKAFDVATIVEETSNCVLSSHGAFKAWQDSKETAE